MKKRLQKLMAGKYSTQFSGSIKLRGKERDVELSTIIPAEA
jgi:hypothetical protein